MAIFLPDSVCISRNTIYNKAIMYNNQEASSIKSRVPCTKVVSQKIQIFQETSFCVLQILLLDFTNTIWQLY